MKRSLVFVVVALLAVVAVEPGSASPAGNVFPFNFVAACSGDTVAVSGQETVIVERRFSVNPAGGVTSNITSFVSGTGVGLETGTTYKLHGVLRSNGYFREGNEINVFTEVQTVILVPDDGGKPLSFQQTIIIIENAQGKFVAFKFLGDPECVPLPE